MLVFLDHVLEHRLRQTSKWSLDAHWVSGSLSLRLLLATIKQRLFRVFLPCWSTTVILIMNSYSKMKSYRPLFLNQRSSNPWREFVSHPSSMIIRPRPFCLDLRLSNRHSILNSTSIHWHHQPIPKNIQPIQRSLRNRMSLASGKMPFSVTCTRRKRIHPRPYRLPRRPPSRSKLKSAKIPCGILWKNRIQNYWRDWNERTKKNRNDPIDSALSHRAQPPDPASKWWKWSRHPRQQVFTCSCLKRSVPVMSNKSLYRISEKCWRTVEKS